VASVNTSLRTGGIHDRHAGGVSAEPGPAADLELESPSDRTEQCGGLHRPVTQRLSRESNPSRRNRSDWRCNGKWSAYLSMMI
jgi:hypothetical protein